MNANFSVNDVRVMENIYCFLPHVLPKIINFFKINSLVLYSFFGFVGYIVHYFSFTIVTVTFFYSSKTYARFI